MRSCTSPAGRLKGHQRDFWIETPFQMQKTKAWRWLFPGRHILIFGGTRSGNTRGKTWDLTRPCTSDLCRMTLSWVGFLTLAPNNQAPLSMEFSRQEYWSGFLFPSPGDLPDPEIDSLPSKPPGKPLHTKSHCFWNGLYRPLSWDTTFVLEEVASCKSTTNGVELHANSKVSVQECRSYKWAHLINEHYNSSHRLNINSNA